MAKRATATNWEAITRDDEGAMVNIDFDCPHCGWTVPRSTDMKKRACRRIS